MALRWRKKLLLAKTETTPGTAIALSANDAILATGVEITPLAGDTVSRELEKPYFGHTGDIPVNSHQTLTFSVELAGSGAAGTAPAWGALVKACGFAEKTVKDKSVAYSPVSESVASMTLGLNIDGQLHTLAGARGSMTLEVNVNQIPKIKFSFTGLYQAPKPSAAVRDPNYSAFQTPLPATKVNTPTFVLHGQSGLALSAFSLDLANTFPYREMINGGAEVLILDRKPTGSVTVDAPELSAINLVERAKQAMAGNLQLVHGTAEGQMVTISAPQVQFGAPSYSDNEGIWQIEAPLNILPQNGNDELAITLT